MAYAAFGRGDGADKCGVVVLIGQEAQPSAEIADFGALKKTLATGYAVGDADAAQGLLKHFGQMVGAVENGVIASLRAALGAAGEKIVFGLAVQALDMLHGAFGFVFFVVAGQHTHRIASAQIAPQGFLKQVGVAADDAVGGFQYAIDRAVVLFQLDNFQLWVVLRQAAQKCLLREAILFPRRTMWQLRLPAVKFMSLLCMAAICRNTMSVLTAF